MAGKLYADDDVDRVKSEELPEHDICIRDVSRLEMLLKDYESGNESLLIPILQQAQEELGYLPEEAMLEISRFAGVPESRVYAVATFYTQFRFTPIGRNHVMVCRGTSCHVRGAPRILEAVEKELGVTAGETTPDMEYSLETVACIGCCGLSPCIMVNDKVYARMTPRRVAEFFAKGDQR